MKLKLFAIAILAGLFLGLASWPLLVAEASPDWSRTSNNVIVNYAPQTLTTSGTQTLTPTVSMYLLAPTDTVTYTLSVSNAVAGDLLILVGTVTTSTIVVDTGATNTGSGREITKATNIYLYNGSAWAEQSFNYNQ